MRNRLIAAAFIIGVVFAVSGLRFVPGVRDSASAISMPVCGPLTDGQGNSVGDAGPCPSLSAHPEQLVWAPFWLR